MNTTNEIVVPNGTMGERHTNPSKMEPYDLKTRNTGKPKIDPVACPSFDTNVKT